MSPSSPLRAYPVAMSVGCWVWSVTVSGGCFLQARCSTKGFKKRDQSLTRSQRRCGRAFRRTPSASCSASSLQGRPLQVAVRVPQLARRGVRPRRGPAAAPACAPQIQVLEPVPPWGTDRRAGRLDAAGGGTRSCPLRGILW